MDQRLARERYFDKASPAAWILYLFLLTVANPEGTSFYSERTVLIRLGIKADQLATARRELIAHNVIAYRPPVYQVLALKMDLPSG